jgi:hypothetical protein
MPNPNINPVLDFVVFYCADLDAAQETFTRLGFEYYPEESAPNFRQFKGVPGGPAFGLSQAGENTPPAGTAQVYFETTLLEDLHQRTLDNGVETSPIRHMPFGDIFTLPAARDLQNVVLLRDK